MSLRISQEFNPLTVERLGIHKNVLRRQLKGGIMKHETQASSNSMFPARFAYVDFEK